MQWQLMSRSLLIAYLCTLTMILGLSSPLPYFYPIYFAVLLIHRELRDEEKCHKKYGKDWDAYCEKVRWRIIPYVY